MLETVNRRLRECRARALILSLTFFLSLFLLLALAGCSEAENGTGGPESGKTAQETAQQTTVAETTEAPTTGGSGEQAESGDNEEDQARRDSSDDGPDRDSESQPQSEPAPEPQQASGSGGRSPGGGSDQPPGLASRGQVVTVSRVVDGDTIEVSPAVDGIQDVRLIGVDTPETYGGTEPLGDQASAFTKGALTGRRVALEFDEERIDPYGRVLAYVWTSTDAMFNSQLLRRGLAQVATFPPNTEYVDQFESTQRQARAENRGIWSLSQAQQCQLADGGNGIGEGTPGCTGASQAPQQQSSPQLAPQPRPAPAIPTPSGGDLDCSDFLRRITRCWIPS